MSFHFVSHPWHVQEIDDGTVVKVSAQDLDDSTLAIMVDDLFDLSMAEGRPNLYLDFQEVRFFPHMLVGQLVALDERLRQVGGRLVLQQIDPALMKRLLNTELADILGAAALAN
jgi:anti-anti-sigma regulatory factor